METDVLIALCIVAALVIGVNGALLLLARQRGRGRIREIDTLKTTFRRASNPWEKEDERLKELSERVAALKEKNSHPKDITHL